MVSPPQLSGSLILVGWPCAEGHRAWRRGQFSAPVRLECLCGFTQEGLNPEPFCDAFKNGFAFALIYCQRIGNIAQTSGFTLCQHMIGDAD